MHAVVVGAGAWGLPTATELVRRGHRVSLVDRYGVGNPLSSSSGPTRLWRLADPEPAAIRLGRRALAATRRLEAWLGRRLLLEQGLLWRDEPAGLAAIAAAVGAERVRHRTVPAAAVGEALPGLVPDERDALWFPEAGSLLSGDLLDGCHSLFTLSGGTEVLGTVTEVRAGHAGAEVVLDDGGALAADAVVVCAGPGTPDLLPGLGLEIPLRTYLEQVVHLGAGLAADERDAMPCLFDGPGNHGGGIYTMPTPGVGYKIGLDDPLRTWQPGDDDRTPDSARTAAIVDRAVAVLPALGEGVVDELVCCWTDSPDGAFVVDRVGSDSGRVVVACGDSGKGFKYAAGMGDLLADLAEGAEPDADVAAMSSRRFAGHDPDHDWQPTALGGVPT
jgi:sarcosine oxidase